MSDGLSDPVAGLDEYVRVVAQSLLGSPGTLASELAEHVIELQPESRAPDIAALVHATCRANLVSFLDSLGRSVPLSNISPPHEVMEYTRALVRTSLPLHTILRGYRLVAADLICRWADAVARHGGPSAISIAAVKQGTAYTLGWLDVVCEHLAAEYRSEADRLAQQRSQARLEAVRDVLADARVTVDAASRRLAYRLAGTHRALVLHDLSERPQEDVLSSVLRVLTGRLGRAEQLAVRPDGRTLWCWVRWDASLDEPVPAPAGPVLLALGRPGEGLDGFRRSHRQAVEAMGIATVTGRPAGTVIDYDDVEVAVLCTGGGVERAREYVDSHLGPLAGPDRVARRARETLTSYFDASSNFRATAARLGIHHNTVRYRIEQAERMLGRPVEERRLALEIALHLAATLASDRRTD